MSNPVRSRRPTEHGASHAASRSGRRRRRLLSLFGTRWSLDAHRDVLLVLVAAVFFAAAVFLAGTFLAAAFLAGARLGLKGALSVRSMAGGDSSTSAASTVSSVS